MANTKTLSIFHSQPPPGTIFTPARLVNVKRLTTVCWRSVEQPPQQHPGAVLEGEDGDTC